MCLRTAEAYPGRRGAMEGAEAKAFFPSEDNTLSISVADEPWIRHCQLQLERTGGKMPPLATAAVGRTHATNLLFQGNMKQHMLTHKIRDMPQHMFDKPPVIEEGAPPPPPPPREIAPSEPEQPQSSPQAQEPPKEQPVKRAPTETELPLPKRPPSECFVDVSFVLVHNRCCF